MNHRSSRFVVLVLGAVLMVQAGCRGSRAVYDADAGRSRVMEEGVPVFDLEVVEAYQESRSGLEVAIGVPRLSLVFAPSDTGFTAILEVTLRVVDRTGRMAVPSILETDTVRVAQLEEARTLTAHLWQRRLVVPAGRYVVEATVTDRRSGREVTRKQGIILPPATAAPWLGRLRLAAGRERSLPHPLLSFQVPVEAESVQVVTEVVGLSPGEAMDVEMTLERLASDTAVAVPPYWLGPSFGSLAYRGIDFGPGDTLQVNRRRLPGDVGEVQMTFLLPGLEPGVYRAALSSHVAGAREGGREARQERVFVVRPPAFPRVATLDQMIQALGYIATPKEMAHILAAEAPAERRARFDAFWGMRVPNRERAANLVRLYYSRIEEANLRYSSHKDGWKTDRGMVYAVMGAPLHSEDRLEEQVWFYSLYGYDPSSVFVFERISTHGWQEIMPGYVLQRTNYQQQAWRRAVERWRDGSVL